MNTKKELNDTLLSYAIGLVGTVGVFVLAFIIKDSAVDFINDKYVLSAGAIILLSGLFEHRFRMKRNSYNEENIPDLIDRTIYIVSFFLGSFLIFLGIL